MTHSGYTYKVEATDTHLIVDGVEWGSVGSRLPIHHLAGTNHLTVKLTNGA